MNSNSLHSPQDTSQAAGSAYRRVGVMLAGLVGLLLFGWCTLTLLATVGCSEKKPSIERHEGVVAAVELAGKYESLGLYGDIWTATQGPDDRLYLAFGDGTGLRDHLPTLLMNEPDEFDAAYERVSEGRYRIKPSVVRADPELAEVFEPGKSYPLGGYTPAGLVALRGEVGHFAPCGGPHQCIVARHIPYGDLSIHERSDKPSSILFVGRRLYAHMHYPPGKPTDAYLAFSDDLGKTWRKVGGSPWKAPLPFTVMMFIQMGKAYDQNADGYLYALGVRHEVSLDPPTSQPVYLARVPIGREAATRGGKGNDPVLDYRAYRYFAGIGRDGRPSWKRDPRQAKPLAGLSTLAQGSAMYHAGLGRFLFFSGFSGEMPGRSVGITGPGSSENVPVGTLYEAPYPWGPWRPAGHFPGGYIGSLLPIGATADQVYFTAAGGGGVKYCLNIGRLRLRHHTPAYRPPRFVVQQTRKVEQIIGDLDFETVGPTRQRTESRFRVAYTDLGVPLEHDGKLWLLFGDTDPEAPGTDPRHDDSLAWTDARDVRQFRLHFLKDPRRGRGYANPVIACPKTGNPDCVDLGALNVPVAAVSSGKTMFVWFTADAASRSLLARSNDNGRTFEKVYDFARSRFIDLAAAWYPGELPGLTRPAGDQWVLIFGSGDKAHRDVYIAATTRGAMERGDRSAVRFLSGIRRKGTADEVELRWSPWETDAVPVFRIEHGDGPGVMSEVPHGWGFGEPLIHYNGTLQCWVATYNSARRTIRMRTAPQPWGPWSDSVVLFDPAKDYGRGPAYGRYIGDDRTERLGGQGELYGPYVLERFTRRLDDGRVKLYWLLSPWQPYTVLLMESTLEPIRPVAVGR